MKQGLSWLSSLLMDFGLASVMFVRCESSVSWSLSQSPGFEGEEDNQEFIEQTAFRETHEKNHATLAKFATTARESQMKAFFTGIRTIALTSHTTNNNLNAWLDYRMPYLVEPNFLLHHVV